MIPLLIAASFAARAGGTVDLRSEPSGAALTVDGQGTAALTPARLELPAGVHHVSAALGCDRAEATVSVREGEAARVDLRLQPVPGEVLFLPDPPEVEITVDGLPVRAPPGEPVGLPCGEHRVKATLPGATPVVLSFDLGPGQSLTLPVRLEVRAAARLEVDLTPDTARLFVDGVDVGVGDRALDPILEGPHQVRAEAPGFSPAEATLVLGPGERRQLALDLTPTAARPALDGAKVARAAGWTSLGVGGALLAFAGVQYLSHLDEWRTYRDAGADVQAGRMTASEYDRYYETHLAGPQRHTLVGGVTGGLLVGLGGGLLLVF
jgi:hypothetical protein